MSWTNPANHIFATGEVVTASTLNTYVEANLAYIGAGFGAIMWQNAAQNIPSAAQTVVAFDRIENDPSGMTTTGTGAKITVPAGAAGVYAISANVLMATPGSSTLFFISLLKNGAEVSRGWQGTVPSGTVNPCSTASTQVALVAADYVQVTAYQSGNAAGLNTGPGQNLVRFAMHLLGPV